MQNNSTTREEVAHRVHDAVDTVKHGLSSAKDEASRRVTSMARLVGGTIKDHPFATVAVGIGLGFLIAKLRAR